MRKIWILGIILFSIILGGCQMGEKKDLLPKDMDVEDLPEGRAFEDEFTRKQLQSTEEVMPGYYPFLASNGKYKMAFPKEGLTYGGGYTSKDNFEFLSFTDWEEDKPTSATVSVIFTSYSNAGFEHIKQQGLESNIGMQMEFEEIEAEG